MTDRKLRLQRQLDTCLDVIRRLVNGWSPVIDDVGRWHWVRTYPERREEMEVHEERLIDRIMHEPEPPPPHPEPKLGAVSARAIDKLLSDALRQLLQVHYGLFGADQAEQDAVLDVISALSELRDRVAPPRTPER